MTNHKKNYLRSGTLYVAKHWLDFWCLFRVHCISADWAGGSAGHKEQLSAVVTSSTAPLRRLCRQERRQNVQERMSTSTIRSACTSSRLQRTITFMLSSSRLTSTSTVDMIMFTWRVLRRQDKSVARRPLTMVARSLFMTFPRSRR